MCSTGKIFDSRGEVVKEHVVAQYGAYRISISKFFCQAQCLCYATGFLLHHKGKAAAEVLPGFQELLHLIHMFGPRDYCDLRNTRL